MKKYWSYIVTGAVLIAVFQARNDYQYRESTKEQLAKRDSTINIQKYEIARLRKQMKYDSIIYEKEKQHIKDLRDRYPDNTILDSLFRAGQSID